MNSILLLRYNIIPSVISLKNQEQIRIKLYKFLFDNLELNNSGIIFDYKNSNNKYLEVTYDYEQNNYIIIIKSLNIINKFKELYCIFLNFYKNLNFKYHGINYTFINIIDTINIDYIY